MPVRNAWRIEPRVELAEIKSISDVQHFKRPCHFAHHRGARSMGGVRLYSSASDCASWLMVAAHIMLAGHRA